MPDAPTPQEIEALLARVPEGFTPGPWQWWTSNSWRRLKRDAPGITTPVAEPFVASDRHPDLCISREDMALVALAPDLALALRALADERDRHLGLLWFAWSEFNAIRARHGAPIASDGMHTCAPDWWDAMTEAFAEAIGEDAQKPWPGERTKAIAVELAAKMEAKHG